MGLQVNKINAAVIAFKQEYCNAVADRLNLKAWSFPKRWECQVLNSISNAEMCNAKITLFVKAQFASMPANFCERIFNAAYPPISTFVGERARARYRTYIQDVESKATRPEPMTTERIKEMIRREVALLVNMQGEEVEGVNIDNLAVLFSSGSLSTVTLAYLYLHDQISFEQVGYVIDALPKEDRHNAMDLVLNYKTLIPTTKIGL